MIYQLIYASTPQSFLSIREVEGIVEKARVNNKQQSITGFICCSSKFFIQCIEGDKDVVLALYEKISQDPRHHRVHILIAENCDQRSFQNWSMGVVLGMDKHQDILRRYCDNEPFNPYQLSPQQSLHLLKDFSAIRMG